MACHGPNVATATAPDVPNYPFWGTRSNEMVQTYWVQSHPLGPFADADHQARLPAPVNPLLKAWALGTDRGVIAMAWHHDGLGRERRKHELVDRFDDGVEVAAVLGGPRPTREQGVTGEQHRGVHQLERHPTVCVAGGLDRAKSELANLEDLLVVDDLVIARQHRGVLFANVDAVARIAHFGDCSDVVMMTVGLQDLTDAQLLREFKQEAMFVRGVDQDGITGISTPDDEDVVLVVTDHDPMNFCLVILVVEGGPSARRGVDADMGCAAIVLDGSAQVMWFAHGWTLHRAVIALRASTAVVGSPRHVVPRPSTVMTMIENEVWQEVLRHETQVWDALVAGNARADSDLLADDFLGVYPTGFGDKAQHVAQLMNGPTVAEFSIHDVAFRSLSDSVILVAYLASYRRREVASVEEMFVTSIWSKREGRWTNVFSQDTPRSDTAVP